MRSVTFSLILLAFATVQAAAARPCPTRFADFPVSSPYLGKIAPIDFRGNPDAMRFRTQLREASRTRPNYAGHVIVVTWGCGTDCEVSAFVDARSGKVSFGPIAEYGFSYRVGSRLLIVNPPETLKQLFGSDPPGWAKTECFFWHDPKPS